MTSKFLIFSGFGIDLIQQNDGIFIRYDAGEISDKIIEQEITREEAEMAQHSAEGAYKVILAAQRRTSI